MIKAFKNKKNHFDVLVLIIGHNLPHFMIDTAKSFDHYNRDCNTSYRIAFAVDYNQECADVLSENYDNVYRSSVVNGWGRGIIRTMAYALDYFKKQGLSWEHLITIDSDTLIVGPCLDQYMALIEEKVCFVGKKWGGDPPYSSANPGPLESSRRQLKQLAKLGLFDESVKWKLVDYMVAGPFMLWTRQALDFMTKIGILPGSKLDEIYPYVMFPHDQVSTFVLGFEGNEFREIGRSALIHCGDVGGDDEWKTGLPSTQVQIYGIIPLCPKGVSVIHPIRSKKFNEGMVRSYFSKLRGD